MNREDADGFLELLREVAPVLLWATRQYEEQLYGSEMQRELDRILFNPQTTEGAYEYKPGVS